MSITLDHIVILVSPSVLADLPAWLTSSFTVLDGGRHSNAITENKLILFQDGVYIELIAFVQGTSPGKRASTRWGKRNEGEAVDFALTLLQSKRAGDGPFHLEDVFCSIIQDRVRESQTALEYSDPVAGGRVTPDGTELRWAISGPAWTTTSQSVEGELPFWCLDRTPRDLRVPFRSRPDVTNHACGAIGVRAVEMSIVGGEEDRGEKFRTVYTSFLGEGHAAEEKVAGHLFSKRYWELNVPARVMLSSAENSASILTLQNAAQLVIASESSDAEGLSRISLTLFTSGSPAVVSGEIAPGRVLEINLVKVSDLGKPLGLISE